MIGVVESTDDSEDTDPEIEHSFQYPLETDTAATRSISGETVTSDDPVVATCGNVTVEDEPVKEMSE